MVTSAAGTNARDVYEQADKQNNSAKTLTAIRGGRQEKFSDNMVSFQTINTPDNDPEWAEKLKQPRGREKGVYRSGMQLR